MRTVFLNGRMVPESEARVSVYDRGFLYGDGLFETLRVRNGVPFRWEQHLARLERGAAVLGIRMPFAAAELRAVATELVEVNRLPEASLRLTLSRGSGLRGYSPRGADQPTMVMTLQALAVPSGDKLQGWSLVCSRFRLAAGDPLAQIKTANKLPQILARAEAEAGGAQEALLLSTDGFVVEAAGSNLFWVEGNSVCTPPVESGLLPGVTRSVILELCKRLDLVYREASIALRQLRDADGVFLTLSTLGMVEGLSLDGRSLRQSPLTQHLHRAYQTQLAAETDCVQASPKGTPGSAESPLEGGGAKKPLD